MVGDSERGDLKNGKRGDKNIWGLERQREGEAKTREKERDMGDRQRMRELRNGEH